MKQWKGEPEGKGERGKGKGGKLKAKSGKRSKKSFGLSAFCFRLNNSLNNN